SEFWKKLVGWNILVIIAGIEAYFGYTRGLEFSILGSLQSLLSGTSQTAPQNTGEFFPVANSVLGFLNPLLAALTFRYLITLSTWVFASCLGVILFLGLWFPTWLLSRVVLWKQRTHPVSLAQPDERDAGTPPRGTQIEQPDPGAADAAAERAEEERQRL